MAMWEADSQVGQLFRRWTGKLGGVHPMPDASESKTGAPPPGLSVWIQQVSLGMVGGNWGKAGGLWETACRPAEETTQQTERPAFTKGSLFLVVSMGSSGTGGKRKRRTNPQQDHHKAY